MVDDVTMVMDCSKDDSQAPWAELPLDHPGVNDTDYRRRRGAIAQAATRYAPGRPIEVVEYTDAEDEVWAIVSSELSQLHQRFACDEYKRAAEAMVLSTDSVPQLRDVDRLLNECTGFNIRPVPGLVPARQFYGDLADRVFNSTQYIRHHSVPYYTPEPDIIHEIIGHAQMLASPLFADLHELAGGASRRAESDAALEFFSRVFWFTLEFGVVRENQRTVAYGAGLLSSFGEIQVFGDADIRPWDFVAMGTQTYDITRYQPLLFEAPSIAALGDELGQFFSTYDDDTYHRLTDPLGQA